jgi:hypothetical protein
MWRRPAMLVFPLVAFSLLAARPEEQRRQPQAERDRDIADALENVATAVKQKPDTSGTERPCKKRKDDRSSDLCAQWKAADAAQSAADAAWYLGIAGAAIGLFTLLVAIRAGLYARDAARHTESGAQEARRAADTAAEALDLEQRNAAVANRPWLLIESVSAGNVAKGAPNNADGVHFQLRVKNFGTRPATAVFLWNRLIQSEPGASCPEWPNVPIEDHHSIVGPGGGLNSSPRSISASDADAWKAGKIDLWLFARCRYGEPNVADRPYGLDNVHKLLFNGMTTDPDGNPAPRVLPLNMHATNDVF